MAKKKTTKKTKLKKSIPTVVKRGWHIEAYDERKVYGSSYFSCRNAHLSQKEAERIAEKIALQVTKFVSRKKYISSDDIFRFIIEELKKYDEDASFLYETHRDIS